MQLARVMLTLTKGENHMPRERQMSSPRWINIAVGLWLFVSALMWQYAGAQFANSLIVGAAAVIAAGVALKNSELRYANAALAIWLFVSTWVFPITLTATIWNNAIAAIVMLVVALVPNGRPAAYR